MSTVLLCPDYILLNTGNVRIIEHSAVLVRHGRVHEIGDAMAMRQARTAQTQVVELKNQILMPGLVNAHQHGRGVTGLQFGYHDDMLERWIASKQLRAQMSPYVQVLYASLLMIANGVTSAIHANTASGLMSYEDELEYVIKGYADAGLRVLVGIGAMDRAEVVYPHDTQARFLAGLSPALSEQLTKNDRPVYCGGLEPTISLLDQLQQRHADKPLISFGYAPAGPQWVSDEFLSGLGKNAQRHKIPIHMHGLESWTQAVVSQKLYPDGLFKHLGELGVLSGRTSVAHAIWLTPEDVEYAVKHRVILVRNPGSNLRLRNGIAPLASYLEQGVSVALGSDSMALHDDEDLLKELRLAAALARSPDWSDRVPTEDQQWAMVTRNGARAMGFADSLGVIAPGAHADLITIDMPCLRKPYCDPKVSLSTLILGRAQGRDVRMTMVGGKILYYEGQLTDHATDALIAQCIEAGRTSEHCNTALSVEQVRELAKALGEHYRNLVSENNGPATIAARDGWH